MNAKIFTRSFRPYLWIIGAGSVLYYKVLFFGLTYLDDNVVFRDQFNIIKNPANLLAVFHKSIDPEFSGFYRPLSTIPLILAAQFGGPHLLLYHLMDLSFHLLAACLLFSLLARLGYPRLSALLAALLFTVHPALTFNVAWLPGQVDIIMTIFCLSAFSAFLAYRQNAGWRNYFLCLIFFALALFTKEPALLLVLLCPLFLLLDGRRQGDFAAVVKLVPGWLAVGVGWFLARQAVLIKPTIITGPNVISSVGNPASVLLYFGKAVFPFNLAPLPILRDTSLLYGAAALALLAGLLFLTWPRRWGRIAFGLIWFLAFLLPGLVFSEPSQFIGVALYEHRLYLPLIGLLIVFLETGLFRDLDGKNRLGLTVVLAVLAVFSVKTFTYSEIYRDRISFWESAARSSPHHAMARRNLGAIYWLDGKPDKAELEYRQALALNPNEPMVHNNLALIYMEKGRLREAKRELLHELRLNPNYDRALLNLGLLYAQQGRIKEAVALWQKTLEINPANGAAREYLRRLNAR